MVFQTFFTQCAIFKPVLYWLAAILICSSSCQNREESTKIQDSIFTIQSDAKSVIQYAVGFDLVYYQKYKVLHIFQHYNETLDTLSYVLFEKGADIDQKFAGFRKIQIPVQRIALLHSSYISFFNLSETTSYIKAISEAKYIYDDVIYQSVQQGDLPEIGYGESLDKERLLELKISAVVTVGFPNAPNKSQHILEELGIPVIILSDWQETTLLGRAEWVKVIAALTGTEILTSNKFDGIEKEYQRWKSLTSDLNERPKIICNLPYKGAWYVPGGNSYMSNLFYDAGGDYLWSDDNGTGGIQIDFETAYANGQLADFWINPDFAQNISEILDKDERLSDFQPIKKRKVFNSNKRINRNVANDYWESGLINPHLILADLIKTLHPELLPEHDLYYFQKLD